VRPTTARRGLIAAAHLLAASGATCLVSPEAFAGTANRVWVSGHGVDAAGCGAPVSPCRSLQYAHDPAVAAGGEIDILDPAGYGAVTITKAVSIVNDGVGTAGVQVANRTTAIQVNAGPNDAIYLRGLNVEGTQGGVGLSFNSGRSLTVIGCTFRNFENGIQIVPSAGVSKILISDTIASNNLEGVIVVGQGSAGVIGVIDHLVADNNSQVGLGVNSSFQSGPLDLTLDNVQADSNVEGLFLESDNHTAVLTISHSRIDSNTSIGIDMRDAEVHLYASEISNNYFGIDGTVVHTSGDNHIDGNTGADIETTFVAEPTQ
jgi:hypothetical protein